MSKHKDDWASRKQRSYTACLERMAPGLISGKRETVASTERDTKTGAGVIQRLVEAIGRHPAAEADPEVSDAINAVEDALKEEQ